MGFTRSTTPTDVHSTLGDYPNVDDGLTPAQLKARFDAPATGLKGDINTLETELEATSAATSIGADKITVADTSADNVQAKLEKIYLDLQQAAIGDIPDNSITQAKINGTYEATIAKKDGTLQTNLNADKLGGEASSSYALKNGYVQTNLNAEKLGGLTLAQLLTRVSSNCATGTVVMTKTSGQNAAVINLGFAPTVVILANMNIDQNGSYNTCLGLIFANKLIFLKPGSSAKYYAMDITISNNTVVIPYQSYGMDAGTYTYIAFKQTL